MKKIKLFGLFGLLALGGLGLGASNKTVSVRAEGEEEPEIVEPAPLEYTISIECEDGCIATYDENLSVGDMCELNITLEDYYSINKVKANGVELEEYKFEVIEGENIVEITTNFDTIGYGKHIAKEVAEAANLELDFDDLLSVDNVLRIVAWILDGGLLVFMVRYFIKDKKTAEKVEEKVKESINAVIPESTKQSVLATVENFITPTFAKIEAHEEEITSALQSLTKCIALMQEGTPESKIAIINELSQLKLGDKNVTAQVEEYLNEAVEKALAQFNERMAKIDAIEEKNRAILNTNEETELKKEAEPTYDGTSI